VRIIAATNTDLEREVGRGEFRLDLFHRLKVLHLYLPPLRERRGDIALLAQHFVKTASARFAKQEIPIDDQTLAWFEGYHWPGNIRELENVVYRGFLLAEGSSVSIPAPPGVAAADASSAEAPLNYRRAKNQAIAAFESRFLTDLIKETHGNVSAAARRCGAERRYLGRLLKKHGITTIHN
jgi:DNA-binding NtrC family response regulator